MYTEITHFPFFVHFTTIFIHSSTKNGPAIQNLLRFSWKRIEIAEFSIKKGQNIDQNWTKIVYFDSKNDVLHKNGTHGPDFVRG